VVVGNAGAWIPLRKREREGVVVDLHRIIFLCADFFLFLTKQII